MNSQPIIVEADDKPAPKPVEPVCEKCGEPLRHYFGGHYYSCECSE